MNNKWLSLFNDLEISRQSLFEKLDTIDDEILSFRPDASSWSILQVCHHLIVSEELSLQYLNKKLKDKSNIQPSGIGSSIRSFSLNMAMRYPFRLSAPQRVSEFPLELSWTDLKRRWTIVREGLKIRLSTVPEELKNKLVYKHPAAGRLTIFHMLTFFRIHINRHEGQIRKLIKAGSDIERRIN